jgi:hypothetical protein
MNLIALQNYARKQRIIRRVRVAMCLAVSTRGSKVLAVVHLFEYPWHTTDAAPSLMLLHLPLLLVV